MARTLTARSPMVATYLFVSTKTIIFDYSHTVQTTEKLIAARGLGAVRERARSRLAIIRGSR